MHRVMHICHGLCPPPRWSNGSSPPTPNDSPNPLTQREKKDCLSSVGAKADLRSQENGTFNPPMAPQRASRCPSPSTPSTRATQVDASTETRGGRYGQPLPLPLDPLGRKVRTKVQIKVRGHFHVPLSYSILYPAHIPWAATAASAAAARRRRRQKLPFPFRNEITSTSITSGSLLRFPVRWTSRRFSLLHHGGVELAHGCHSLPLTRTHRKTVRSTLPWRRSVPVAAPPPPPPPHPPPPPPAPPSPPPPRTPGRGGGETAHPPPPL